MRRLASPQRARPADPCSRRGERQLFGRVRLLCRIRPWSKWLWDSTGPRRLIQQELRNEGFNPGAPDGLFGPRTRAAVRRWQEAQGRPPTGYLDSVQPNCSVPPARRERPSPNALRPPRGPTRPKR